MAMIGAARPGRVRCVQKLLLGYLRRSSSLPVWDVVATGLVAAEGSAAGRPNVPEPRPSSATIPGPSMPIGRVPFTPDGNDSLEQPRPLILACHWTRCGHSAGELPQKTARRPAAPSSPPADLFGSANPSHSWAPGSGVDPVLGAWRGHQETPHNRLSGRMSPTDSKQTAQWATTKVPGRFPARLATGLAMMSEEQRFRRPERAASGNGQDIREIAAEMMSVGGGDAIARLGRNMNNGGISRTPAEVLGRRVGPPTTTGTGEPA
jgi:hypothetical protein